MGVKVVADYVQLVSIRIVIVCQFFDKFDITTAQVLLTEEEARHTKEFKDHFIIEPEFPFWHKDNFKEGKPVMKGFVYSSDNNTEWLEEGDLKNILKKI